MFRIESLLSARLFINPQVVGERIYFLSNLSGHLSLYAMKFGGSVPEPLLPPNIALQNPHLIGGYPFYVFPKINKIIVMIDRDGDEKYQPMTIPVEGGFPDPILDNFFSDSRVHFVMSDPEMNIVYFSTESEKTEFQSGYQVNLESETNVKLGSSIYGAYPTAHSQDHRRVILADSYSMGDTVLYLWEAGRPELKLVYGIPLQDRKPDQTIPANGISSVNFTSDEHGLLLSSAVFEDTYGPGYLSLQNPGPLQSVEIDGLVHSGAGELESLDLVSGDIYRLVYNIDGVSWGYEAEYEQIGQRLVIKSVICGQGLLGNGMLNAMTYDEVGDRYVLSFSTATSPTQIYTLAGKKRELVAIHTAEKVLGISTDLLSGGEDASFTSFDGTRISARLYLPSPQLGFKGARPLVYYVHGGPQSQERPDFAWFSMPLIQFLTLNGFAVFVPNVRGSTGYGLKYTKEVDRDWGGKDRLDHVHALKILAQDQRVDVNRAGVVGRSYGGYMTLTLAGWHPELWKAAVDMFGPFDLITFLERIPETWKPYYRIALGDAEIDREFLVDRSPKTHIDQITAPLLVIQGKNDPRVVERESHDLVEHLQAIGKQTEYLMFENEGHDVLKYENRVRCYTAITEFFVKYLHP